MKKLLSFATILTVLFCCGTVSASVIWDGSIDPSAAGLTMFGESGYWHVNTDENGAAPGYTMLDSTPDYTKYASLGLDNPSAEFNRSEGWFVELGVKPLINVGVGWWYEDNDFYGSYFGMEDDIGGIGMFLKPGTLVFMKGDGSNKVNYDIPLDIFVDIRVEMAANGSYADFIVNGLLAASLSADVQNISSPNFFLGDGSSHSKGKAVFDYLQINSPEPVPEPATMLLLGSGLLGLVSFRRKMIKRRQ